MLGHLHLGESPSQLPLLQNGELSCFSVCLPRLFWGPKNPTLCVKSSRAVLTEIESRLLFWNRASLSSRTERKLGGIDKSLQGAQGQRLSRESLSESLRRRAGEAGNMVRREPTKVCGRNASSAFPQNSTGFTAKYFDCSAIYQVAASLVQDLPCMRDSWPLCHRKGRIGFWFYSASTQPRGHS